MNGDRRVLITNDDGIASEGLRRLALLAVELDLDVVVAAPSTDSSGASASLAAVRSDGHIPVHEDALAGLDGVPAFAVEAAPAFITRIASRGAFGPPPTIVLSGINAGQNAGQSVLHSGTVGAALTGASYGCRCMAVSLAAGDPPRWGTAVDVARRVVPALLDAPGRTVVNVNAPNLAVEEVRGLCQAGLASFGAVQTNIAEVGKGFVRLEVVEVDGELEPGTDAALLADGWATLTALAPLCVSHAEPFQTILSTATTV